MTDNTDHFVVPWEMPEGISKQEGLLVGIFVKVKVEVEGMDDGVWRRVIRLHRQSCRFVTRHIRSGNSSERVVWTDYAAAQPEGWDHLMFCTMCRTDLLEPGQTYWGESPSAAYERRAREAERKQAEHEARQRESERRGIEVKAKADAVTEVLAIFADEVETLYQRNLARMLDEALSA